jgi:ABC-2 type transport system ATP-binding protein
MQKAAVSIAGLTKKYKKRKRPLVQALSNLNLTINTGEIFVLLGPNGAGKSTAINIIAGLTKKTSGSVCVFGYDVERDYKVTRRLVGLVPQEPSFDRIFTVRETLLLQSGLMGVQKKKQWVDEIIERLDLSSHAKKTPMELSGGMRRRLLVAKALVHRPKLLILDEPTAGVDIELRQALWTFVLELHTQGATILLTTHYLEEAERVADRVGLINNGRLQEIDTLAEIKRKHESATLEEAYLKLTRNGL